MITQEQTPHIGYTGTDFISFVPKMMNRHGLITGATGTGKTVTLQTLAETFSQLGISVFAADMKGDLSGVAKRGGNKESVQTRVNEYGLEGQGFAYQSFPVEFWDAFGDQGHPLRLTISSLGPMLLERLLDLNATQGGVLNLIFKIADDNNLLLIDLKDLQAMVKFVGDNRARFTTQYGNISPATIGAIQRALLRLESEGGHLFFGEPELDLYDLFRSEGGKGVINVLAADKLSRSPRIYTTFLLWLLSTLYETMPEVGDMERPKMVFFFDEAHLLFSDMSKVLLERVEQIIRLIRSKGIGIYFCTQAPSDIPDSILGQLGNKVQHALRAYTPADQKALRAAAQGLRPNPAFDTVAAISELRTGEAILSMLDPKGAPEVSQRASVLPPQSFIGPLTTSEREELMERSLLRRKYKDAVDNDSAFEVLDRSAREEERQQQAEQTEQERLKRERDAARTARAESGRRSESDMGGLLGDLFKQITKSTSRQISNELGKSITRTILGTLLGGRKR